MGTNLHSEQDLATTDDLSPRRPIGEAGFTLVEIMVVVCILAILVMIATPTWRGARMRAQARVCVRQLRDMSEAKDAWALDLRQPATATPVFTDLCPNYLRTEPECPESGIYTLNSVDMPPECSIGGTHVWQ